MTFSPDSALRQIDAAKSAYRFDNNDLIANRDGRLSERQYDRLWRKARQASSVYAGAALVPLIPFMVVFGSRSANGRVSSRLALALAIVVIVGFGVSFLLWASRFGPSLRSRRVQAVSGRVAVIERGRHGAAVIGQGTTSVEVQLNERTRQLWGAATTATVYFTTAGQSPDVQSVDLPAFDANESPPLVPDRVAAFDDVTPVATFDALKERYGFTDLDLEHNRVGELSPSQQQWFMGRGVRQFRAICVIGTSLSFWIAYTAGRYEAPHRFDWPTALGVFGAITAIAVAFPLLTWWVIYRWVLRRGPRTATGLVSFVAIRMGVQGVRIGPTSRFNAAVVPFEPGDEDLFVEGDAMTVHFAMAPKMRVLSAGPADRTETQSRALPPPKRPIARVAVMWIASIVALLALGVLIFHAQPAPYDPLPLAPSPLDSLFDN